MDGVSNDNGCLICGRENPIGLQLRPVVDMHARRALLELSIPKHFQGWSGIAHGGILAALLDEVSIHACMGESDQLVTAGINVRYYRPVPLEQPVVVTAEVVEIKRRRFKVLAKLVCAGILCAEAETTVVNLKGGE